MFGVSVMWVGVRVWEGNSVRVRVNVRVRVRVQDLARVRARVRDRDKGLFRLRGRNLRRGSETGL